MKLLRYVFSYDGSFLPDYHQGRGAVPHKAVPHIIAG